MTSNVRLVLACSLAVIGLQLNAANSFAVNAISSGDWSTAGTWNPAEPVAGDLATIDGSLTVTVSQAGEAAGTVDLGTVAGQTGSLVVNAGDLTASGGGLPSIRVGQAAGGIGNLTVSGGTVAVVGPLPDSGFAIGDLMVGDVGNGTMTMTGGTVTANDEIVIAAAAVSTSTVTISGGDFRTTTDGRSILVGFGGNGTLDVSGTAQVTANHDMLVGFLSNATGNVIQSGGTIEVGFMFSNFDNAPAATGNTVNLTMTGGTFNARIAYVMGRGRGNTTMTHSGGTVNVMTNNGDMVVSDGNFNTSIYNISGTASVNLLHNMILGAFGGSNGTVNQTGGTIVANDNVFVGRDSVGVWNISGGSVTATQFDIVLANIFDGSNGTVNQTGGAVTAGRNLVIGRDGTGVYNLSSGTVNAGRAYLGDFDSSLGTMKVSGGTLNLTGNLSVGGPLATNAPPDGTRTGDQGQALDAKGNFIVSGNGGTINVGGHLLANPADKTRPGAPNQSTLTFEIFGAPGTSLINVAGNGDLDGAVIDLDLMPGYTPTVGMTFDLVTALLFGSTGTGTTQNTGTGTAYTLAAEDVGAFTLAIVGGGNGQILRATYVPEPATIGLLGFATFGAASIRPRRNTSRYKATA